MRPVAKSTKRMNSLEITFRWIDVQSATGYNYRYPDAVSPHMKQNYCRPAIYKWNVWRPVQGFSGVYVGETDNLARRIHHCLAPGKSQVTNLRLKAYFDEALKREERVELQTLDFEPFRINNVEFSVNLLGHTHVRQFFENFILVKLQSNSVGELPEILNRVLTKDKERSKKRENSAVSALNKLGVTNARAQQFIEEVRLKKAVASGQGS